MWARFESVSADALKWARHHPVLVAVSASLVSVQLLRIGYHRAHRRTERGRRVLCTGAGSGIGKQVATILASKGWVVFALDVNAAALESLRQECGPSIRPVVCSIADDKQVKAAASEVGKDGGSLHALVNVAGISQVGAAASQREEDMMLVMQINGLGAMRLTRECIPLLLRSSDGGNVVNVTSTGGTVAWPWSGTYSSAKAAVEMFSDGLRREAYICGLPLRVTVVAPGAVLTPLLDAFTDKQVQWAEANKNSPFYAGCRRSAMLQKDLKDKGVSASAVGVSARQVAEAVVDALEAHDPPARVLVMHPLFAPMYYLPRWLPARWGDWLLSLV